MSRAAHGCVPLLVAVALLAFTATGSANTITTVAGGGSITPLDFNTTGNHAPTEFNLPSPLGIAWSGAASGLYYFTTGQGTCVQLWQEFRETSASFGVGIEAGTWQNCGVQSGGYPTAQPADLVRLKDPCCVTSNWQWDEAELTTSVGPFVASNSGHVNFYSWPFVGGNTGVTKAGSTPPADCNSLTLEPDNNVAPTSAHLCNISALAQDYRTPYDYAFAERDRGKYSGVLYIVDNSGPTMKVVAKMQPAPYVVAPRRFEGLAWARNQNLVATDGLSALWLFVNKGNHTFDPPVLIGGSANQQGEFTGDGGTAANARFASPKGLAVGFDGALYVADTDNCRIRKLSSPAANATVSTVAGNGCSGAPLADGADATEGNLDHPVGVAMAPIGLLVTDTGHNRIRLIDRTTIVRPPAQTADNTPTFDIRSLDTPSHIKCQVDNVDYYCAAIGPLADGRHTLKAWENGNVGNQPDPRDPTPAVAAFQVDTTGPTGVTLTSPAAGATGVPVTTDFSWKAGTDAIAGIDHYELWIDGAKDRDVPLDACPSDNCTAKASKSLGEGDRTWQIRAVDALGNTTATDVRPFNTSGAPIPAFSISPNPALAGRTVTFDASASSDASGIARYEWDLDGDGSFETDAGGSPTTTRVYETPTTVMIRLRVTDGTGAQASAEKALKVTALPGTQGLLGISIDSGAQYTKDPSVKLLVKTPATANAVLVSNDGGFLAPSTFPVAQSIDWKLDSSGPERLPKTVYVRFMLGPIISETYTDDIILDEIPPVVQSAALVGSKLPLRTAAAAAAKTYTLKIKATDSNSGVSKVQVTANKRKPGKLLAYKTTLEVQAAVKPSFIRAQDRAGNLSAWKKLR